MSEETEKNYNWSCILTGRLCLFGWISVILYECLHSFPVIRQLFLSVGPWICLLAFLHALVFLFLHRQGIFLLFMIISLVPTVYFGIVLCNIVFDNRAVAPVTTPTDEVPPVQKE